jgi:hypothetical protein
LFTAHPDGKITAPLNTPMDVNNTSLLGRSVIELHSPRLAKVA